MNHCPSCGAQLVVRTSRQLDKLREARRECACGYKDVAIVRPEEILSVRVVTTTTQHARQMATSLKFQKGTRNEKKA